MVNLDKVHQGSVCKGDIGGAALVLALEVVGPRYGSASVCIVLILDTG